LYDKTWTNTDKNSLLGFVPDTLTGFKPDISDKLPGYKPDIPPGLEPDRSGKHPGKLLSNKSGNYQGNSSGRHQGKNIKSLRKSELS
jgi:hypothetical protein